MPDFTVIIKAEYSEQAQTPKEAIRRALDRSWLPDKFIIEVSDHDA